MNDTSAQGDFAGWQDPFTDPYGYMNPYLPSAWDSHYQYYPYYYEHPYHWPTPQTGPYPYPSPYVGIQSGPAIVGWDGWQHHHHHHRPWWEREQEMVGIQSGPAIVGVQSGPAIVGFGGPDIEYPGYGFGGWGWGHGF